MLTTLVVAGVGEGAPYPDASSSRIDAGGEGKPDCDCTKLLFVNVLLMPSTPILSQSVAGVLLLLLLLFLTPFTAGLCRLEFEVGVERERERPSEWKGSSAKSTHEGTRTRLPGLLGLFVLAVEEERDIDGAISLVH